MRFDHRWAPLIFALLPMVFGCAGQHAQAPHDKLVIKDVPFYPDDRYLCGPASLAGVLNYWGKKTSIEEIAQAIYSESAKGTLPVDLVWYARQSGLRARRLAGTYRQLRTFIKQGNPVIVFVDLGFWRMSVPHFMVVVGFTEDGVIVNSGEEQKKWYSQDTFVEMWEDMGRWTLLITPVRKASPS